MKKYFNSQPTACFLLSLTFKRNTISVRMFFSLLLNPNGRTNEMHNELKCHIDGVG